MVFRVGSFIVLPGVDPDSLQDSTGGIFGILNNLLGGAFQRASIFALGIMPYITASIVIQLASLAVPYFQRLRKEGESGNRKINQITRVLTILITFAQAFGYIQSTILSNSAGAVTFASTSTFIATSMIILTSGTVFCMWLGERITDKGIGNGISMLIMIGIISSFPGALVEEWVAKDSPLFILFEMIVLFFVVMGCVLLTTAVRRIPIQYASQVAASGGTRRRLTGGNNNQRSWLPIKVNAANVMPIIFAQSLMFVPSLAAGFFQNSDTATYVAQTFSDFKSVEYNVTFALMIIIFTFFYTAIVINPNDMSDHLKRNNAFIPGVKPGESTSKYISQIVDRITLPGALFLALVAILPAFANMAGVGVSLSQFFGGTSLIIMVGVVLDTLQQIESYLLMKHYDGMLKTGKLKGRASMDPVGA